jgi:hypothetical protein
MNKSKRLSLFQALRNGNLEEWALLIALVAMAGLISLSLGGGF